MDMEMHSSNSRPRELLLDGINRKSWWNQRSLLEKMLILIIILLGLLIFGSILYLAVKPSNEKDVCNTRVCLMEASRILEHVDPNIDPCDNFFQFVCGKKLNETLTEWHNRPHAILQDDIESQLLNMLKKPVSSQDTYALKHQKLLFQGCMNETVAEHNSLEIFQEFLKKLKGWPVVVGEEWKEDQLNWTKTILKLRNEGYYHEILIKLVFGYDSEDVGNSILYIYSPRYNLYNDTVNDIDIYKNFMIETATKFGADKHFAEIEMNDVYNLIEKLYMIEEESRYEEDKRITIEEFQNVDNTINWLDFINAYISPARKMSKNTYIMGFGKKFANGLHDLINKTPLRVLYNFIIWKVIEDIMPFLSKEFRELDLRYRCLLRTTVKRVDLCLSLLSNNPITTAEYVKSRLADENKAEIDELFINIKSDLHRRISQLSWFTENVKDLILKRLDVVNSAVGGLGKDLDNSLYKIFVDNKVDLNSKFLDLYLDHKKKDSTFEFLELTLNTSWINFYYSLMAKTMPYLPDGNDIFIIPVGLLQGMFYNSDRHMSFNYGAAGREIAHALVFGIKFQYQKDIDIKQRDKVTAFFNDQTKCLTNDWLSHGSGIVEFVDQVKVLELIGLQIAYQAYQNWIKKNGEEQALIGIDYTPVQLFWISSVIIQCYNGTSNAFQDNKIIQNSPNFATDFNCPKKSTMNPIKKCELYNYL